MLILDASNDTVLVTASHAVFHTDGGRSAPAAVVGFQFQHTALYTLFKNITSNCPEANCLTCESELLDCFVLDNHGYVIIGGEGDTGKFFGDIRGSFMQRLVEERVYKAVRIYDYQAVCFASKESANPANVLKTVRI